MVMRLIQEGRGNADKTKHRRKAQTDPVQVWRSAERARDCETELQESNFGFLPL